MEFMTIAKDFGIPVAFLVFLCFAIWKVLSWFGANVVKPITDRHIAFIDKIEKSILDQAGDLRTLTTESAKVTELNKQNAEHFKTVVDSIQEVKGHMSEVKQVVLKTGSVQIVPQTKSS